MAFNRPRPQPMNPSRPAFSSQASLPQGYLSEGYFDKNGNILDEVIIQWPQQLAKVFFESRPQLKANQLRNFFTFVREQQRRLASGVPFESVITEILKLDMLAQNSLKKGNAPALFGNFIGQNIRFAAKDEKSFKVFVTHFECIVGYYPETNR